MFQPQPNQVSSNTILISVISVLFFKDPGHPFGKLLHWRVMVNQPPFRASKLLLLLLLLFTDWHTQYGLHQAYMAIRLGDFPVTFRCCGATSSHYRCSKAAGPAPPHSQEEEDGQVGCWRWWLQCSICLWGIWDLSLVSSIHNTWISIFSFHLLRISVLIHLSGRDWTAVLFAISREPKETIV